jgi:hypothetical protein
MLRVVVVENQVFITDGGTVNSICHPIQTSSASCPASYPMNNERLYIPDYKIADFGQKIFLCSHCNSTPYEPIQELSVN